MICSISTLKKDWTTRSFPVCLDSPTIQRITSVANSLMQINYCLRIFSSKVSGYQRNYHLSPVLTLSTSHAQVATNCTRYSTDLTEGARKSKSGNRVDKVKILKYCIGIFNVAYGLRTLSLMCLALQRQNEKPGLTSHDSACQSRLFDCSLSVYQSMRSRV